MYDYEYEDDVLGVLRVLKYLYLYRPSTLASVLKFYGEIDADGVEEVACNVIWEIFEVSDLDLDEESDMEMVVIQDPLFDRFLELNRQRYQCASCSTSDAHQKKFQDTVEYYLCGVTYSIFDIMYEFSESGVTLRLWLSPDCFEPISLGSALVDLMLAIRKENELLESLWAETANGVTALSNQPREEAA
jgi:hypothetical protein